MWHVDSYTRYHIIRVVAATEEEQASHQQQANHDDDDRRRTNEAEAAAVGCWCCCRCGGEGALPTNENESRMTKKETGGKSYRKQVMQKHLLLDFKQLGIVDIVRPN